MFTRLRLSPPHSTIRFGLTILVMLIPLVAAANYWSRANGTGTRPFDPTTLLETSIMNAVGLVLIYGVGRTRLMAAFKHLGGLLSRVQYDGAFGDFVTALFIAALSSIAGWLMVWQTISPGATGLSVTHHFVADIGTAQFYKSGFQTLIGGNVLAIFLYAVVQHIKMSRTHQTEPGVRMPAKNAQVRSAKSKGSLQATRGNAVTPTPAWAAHTDRIG